MHYKTLFSLIIFLAFAGSALAVVPRRVVPAEPLKWTNPAYSPDGFSLAFAAADGNSIWAIDLNDEREPSRVARGDSIGRRFVFEPDNPADRIVYRMRINAHPAQPVRLTSTSIHIFDPGPRSDNLGEIIGPYAFAGKLWYRHSLLDPYRDSAGAERRAGPYLDLDSKTLRLLSAEGDTLYTSPPAEAVAGFEISPDGKWVAVVASAPSPVLYLLATADGTRRDLGSGFWPAWSGNSQRLACLVTIRNNTLIRVHDLAANKSFSLDFEKLYDPISPALNPDGSEVAFISDHAVYVAEVK
jgi:Tol biopolymer transport system component